MRLGAGDADAHRVLAQLHQLKAEPGSDEEGLGKAAEEYEEVVRLDPGDGPSLLALASVYGQLQKHKEAVSAWQRYLALDPGNFDGYLQMGSHYLALGDSSSAAAALGRALEVQPGSVRAYQRLAEIYARAQQTDQAILHYRKALELESGDIRLRLSLGDVLLRAKRYDEALAEGEAVLQADPANRFGLELKGRALRELKQFDKAAEAADKALAEDPTDLKAAYLKITIAEARRDYAAAAASLEAILARNRSGEDRAESGGNDRVFLIHLGFAYQQMGRYGDSAGAFSRAKAVGGEPDAALLAYYGEALLLAREHDRAVAEVRAARQRFPEDADLAALEANAVRSKGDMAAAVELIGKLRRKAPKDVKTLLQVADFYQKARRYSDAESVLREALEVEPANLRVLFQLGATIERQKRPDEAEAVLRRALEAQPDSAPVLNYLGYMNADRGVHLEEALALTEKAVTLDPDNSAYLDSLGWALYRLNRLDQAEENLRKAVAKGGVNAVILDHLGDTLKRRGALEEAVRFGKRLSRARTRPRSWTGPRCSGRFARPSRALMPRARTASRALRVPGFTLLLGACATAWPPAPPALLDRARAAGSYSGRLRVTLNGSTLRARTRALVAFRRPDSLRLEIPGPTGARLLAVARAGSLAAVFPGERAAYGGGASAADLEALLGVALTPEEVMDLLVGTPSPRLRSYRARWGRSLPRAIKATLPDGARLDVAVEEAELDVSLPDAAFTDPPHSGYRRVAAEEARALWSRR